MSGAVGQLKDSLGFRHSRGFGQTHKKEASALHPTRKKNKQTSKQTGKEKRGELRRKPRTRRRGAFQRSPARARKPRPSPCTAHLHTSVPTVSRSYKHVRTCPHGSKSRNQPRDCSCTQHARSPPWVFPPVEQVGSGPGAATMPPFTVPTTTAPTTTTPLYPSTSPGWRPHTIMPEIPQLTHTGMQRKKRLNTPSVQPARERKNQWAKQAGRATAWV